ncbi:hypothetical protein GCM10007320_20810 [Pseudorhodoferax aquiterrae]|uniref:Chain length determinant protein tyrosine kinase EpsG n=1 Tax=Pseudorhodoferax aquiterrae TaxID=747304 RepID=A0ABQ3G0J9_9BURK|nr:polysaccharide biosynthesis tyrosine autokinase [Pseudorhodoferax aquiterrae]GHC79706.1 hypothetical protein GCM10007320_20810 [Pseudorhodoferax aquiterrae]
MSDLSDTPGNMLRDRSIGAIIAEARNLSADQVERVLRHQRDHGIRFGEAAIALGFASPDDVLEALSQQFHYPYSPNERGNRSAELVTLFQPFSRESESFRAIRSQLLSRLYREGMPRRPLAVISPDSMDGKSYFAANLAVTLAQLEGKTLLIDADMRSPRQHTIFDIPNQSGLSSILLGRKEERVIQAVHGVPGLLILPLGAIPPNPVELLERPAFGLLLKELGRKFDHIVLDTSAFSRGADASIVAMRCGAALAVARKSASRMNDLQDLSSIVAGGATELIGAVVNEF